jgi:hypothetical protein
MPLQNQMQSKLKRKKKEQLKRMDPLTLTMAPKKLEQHQLFPMKAKMNNLLTLKLLLSLRTKAQILMSPALPHQIPQPQNRIPKIKHLSLQWKPRNQMIKDWMKW